MSSIDPILDEALKRKDLLESSVENIRFVYGQADSEEWEKSSIEELVENGEWTELNDRFFRALKFGTGGLRGRTIGKVVTKAEEGRPDSLGRPEFPAVGTNSMNYRNISRAVQGVTSYIQKTFPDDKPKLVFSHDTRHFSRAFAELCADIVSKMGGDAYLMEEDRSTPELSYAVRHLGCHAGAMITASHNPPHDNGFKVYFADGAQIVEPHASSIVGEVQAVVSSKVEASAEQGSITTVGKELDDAYLRDLASLVIEPEVVAQQKDAIKFVFSPIHGTGIRSVPAILEKFGFSFAVVPEQEKADGRFPTVKSPNPENAEALNLAIEQAKRENADVVLATDPDADRMGVAVKSSSGEFVLLTGNQIGSVMAGYRLERFFEKGILNSDNAAHACLIKTYVTTDLQKTIADSYGVKCVDTLTGFKYIGEKLKDYEELAGGRGAMDAGEWRNTLLEKSSFFVFGGEESYGYSGGDYVRDKDANAAVVMFAEVCAYLSSKGQTVLDYLDSLYTKHGLYWERLGTLTFEGAEGAEKIQRLLSTYRENPPADWAGIPASAVKNFAEEDLEDVDGKAIPKEKMLMFTLEGGTRIVVRGSGTEPKIKFYFLSRDEVSDASQLDAGKAAIKKTLEGLWEFTQADVKARVG